MGGGASKPHHRHHQVQATMLSPRSRLPSSSPRGRIETYQKQNTREFEGRNRCFEPLEPLMKYEPTTKKLQSSNERTLAQQLKVLKITVTPLT
eukprot:gene5263-5645_t